MLLCGAPYRALSRSVGFGMPRLKQPGELATYRENSSSTQPRPIGQPFSVSPDLARLSRRMQECEGPYKFSTPRCASPQEALSWHHQAPTSSTRSIQAEKLLLWGSRLPPFEATPPSTHCKPDSLTSNIQIGLDGSFLLARPSLQCGAGPW